MIISAAWQGLVLIDNNRGKPYPNKSPPPLKTPMQRFRRWLQAVRDVRAAYATAHNRKLSLTSPLSFTEKINWRKLFDDNALFVLFSDKLATRDWVSKRIDTEYLAPLLWTGTPEAIPFDRLEPPYFLKSSHASGQTIMVTKENAHEAEIFRAQAAAWLQIDWFDITGERGYKKIPRRLLIEKALLNEGGDRPLERRFFMFNGKVEVINTVFVENGLLRNGAFHTVCWQYLGWFFTREVAQEFPRPERLDEMIELAEILAAGIDHIRVDFFDCGKQIFVGELTPYSWSGLSHFNPDSADLLLGSKWQLKRPVLRAIKAMLFTDR